MDTSNLPEAVSLINTLVDRIIESAFTNPAFVQMTEDLSIDEDELQLKLKASMDLIEQELEDKQRTNSECDKSARKDGL